MVFEISGGIENPNAWFRPQPHFLIPITAAPSVIPGVPWAKRLNILSISVYFQTLNASFVLKML